MSERAVIDLVNEAKELAAQYRGGLGRCDLSPVEWKVDAAVTLELLANELAARLTPEYRFAWRATSAVMVGRE